MTLSQAFLANNGFKTAAEDFRNFVQATFRGGQGTIWSTDFTLTSGSGLSLNYGTGYAVVAGTALATQGSYFVWDDSGGNITWPAANPSNPRIDALVLFVCDSQYGTATVNDGAQWIIVQGTPAGSPSAPSSATIAAAMPGPGGYLEMATVLVPTAASSLLTTNITQITYPAANSHLVQSIVNPNNISNLSTSLTEIFRMYIPANSLGLNQVIKFTCAGGINGGSTSNYPVVKIYLNGVNTYGPIPPTNWSDTGSANAMWKVDGSALLTATGSSGSIAQESTFSVPAGSGMSAPDVWGNNAAATTFNTTVTNVLSVYMGANVGAMNQWNVSVGWAEKIW
jgi:hypothetical protein